MQVQCVFGVLQLHCEAFRCLLRGFHLGIRAKALADLANGLAPESPDGGFPLLPVTAICLMLDC